MSRASLILLLACLNGLFIGRPAWSETIAGSAEAALAAPAPCPEVAPLQLVAAAEVDSRGVLFSQLVESDLAGLNPALSNLVVVAAPAPNQALQLSRLQIAEAVRKQLGGPLLSNWSGAETVRLSRRMRPLDEAQLKELLTATLQREQVKERGELELRLGRPWSTLSVPDEPLSIKVLELPSMGVTPNFILRFELRTAKESLSSWQLPLQARLWRELWVARSPQPRGRALREADLESERRDWLLQRDALLVLEREDASLELAENLATGAPLLSRSVRQRPIVTRGKLLDAIVEEGSLLITVKVEALEDGLAGQLIRVRNAKSKHEFHAKVQNEQTVAVSL